VFAFGILFGSNPAWEQLKMGKAKGRTNKPLFPAFKKFMRLRAIFIELQPVEKFGRVFLYR
jgi:hypothetical protein